MSQLRSFGAIVLALVVLVVGQALSAPMSVAASSGQLPEVPGDIAVPPGSVLLFSGHAKGVQIYECKDSQWVLHAPRALLFDPETNQPIVDHYGGIDQGLAAGPWWESRDDGSRIHGGRPKTAPSTNPDSIPLLRLEVLDREGAGVFTPVTHIHRLNTVGGLAPTGECQTGAQHPVVYTADYYFYAAP